MLSGDIFYYCDTVILTFANTDDVILSSEQQRQALHQ